MYNSTTYGTRMFSVAFTTDPYLSLSIEAPECYYYPDKNFSFIIIIIIIIIIIQNGRR